MRGTQKNVVKGVLRNGEDNKQARKPQRSHVLMLIVDLEPLTDFHTVGLVFICMI